MTSTNAFTIRPSNKEGKTDYFVVQLLTGKELEFAGQVPEDFALKHAPGIFSCANCMNYTWCGVFIAMCADCGLKSGAQRGLINYGQEYDWEDHAHLPSVFDSGQYLHNWDLAHIGDKKIVNTIGILVDNLYKKLLDKFGDEKMSAIHDLCEYLCSLDNEPRMAISRINKSMYDIAEENLYDRGLWWDNFFASLEDHESSYMYTYYKQRTMRINNENIVIENLKDDSTRRSNAFHRECDEIQRKLDELECERENDNIRCHMAEEVSLEYRRQEMQNAKIQALLRGSLS
jgi:hypothetical protein